MSRVAIIVLHFGDKYDTFECLSSLNKLDGSIKHKVFVVDNGTYSLTKKELQEKLPNSILITNKTNEGFSKGNNKAISIILKENFSHIFLLNNDTIVSPNLLTELLRVFDDPAVGIAGPAITYEQDPSLLWFAGGYMNKIFCFTKHLYMNKEIAYLSQNISDTDFITGAAMMIKRDVFKTVGLLPEDYFLYWEDVDFCFNAKRKGYLCKVLEKNLVKHKVSSASGIKGSNTLSPVRAYYYARNPFIFIKKNNISKITGTLGQFLVLPFYLRKTQNRDAVRMYLKGFFEGLQLLFT